MKRWEGIDRSSVQKFEILQQKRPSPHQEAFDSNDLIHFDVELKVNLLPSIAFSLLLTISATW